MKFHKLLLKKNEELSKEKKKMKDYLEEVETIPRKRKIFFCSKKVITYTIIVTFGCFLFGGGSFFLYKQAHLHRGAIIDLGSYGIYKDVKKKFYEFQPEENRFFLDKDRELQLMTAKKMVSDEEDGWNKILFEFSLSIPKSEIAGDLTQEEIHQKLKELMLEYTIGERLVDVSLQQEDGQNMKWLTASTLDIKGAEVKEDKVVLYLNRIIEEQGEKSENDKEKYQFEVRWASGSIHEQFGGEFAVDGIWKPMKAKKSLEQLGNVITLKDGTLLVSNLKKVWETEEKTRYSIQLRQVHEKEEQYTIHFLTDHVYSDLQGWYHSNKWKKNGKEIKIKEYPQLQDRGNGNLRIEYEVSNENKNEIPDTLSLPSVLLEYNTREDEVQKIEIPLAKRLADIPKEKREIEIKTPIGTTICTIKKVFWQQEDVKDIMWTSQFQQENLCYELEMQDENKALGLDYIGGRLSFYDDRGKKEEKKNSYAINEEKIVVMEWEKDTPYFVFLGIEEEMFDSRYKISSLQGNNFFYHYIEPIQVPLDIPFSLW